MSSIRISARIRALPASETLVINSRVQALRSAGADVVNFSVGEPDFPTPARICEAAMRAIRSGHTRYTPVQGIPALREAIVAQLHRDYLVRWTPDQVCVSNGGKQALYNFFQALLDPGDEVIILSPYWLSYPPQVELAGGVPVIVPTLEQEGFQVDVARLEAACTPRTRAIVLNSPGNPTGVCYSVEVLTRLAELAQRRDLILVSDDLYYRLRYDDLPFVSVAALIPHMPERTLVVGGLSKAYAMTGWRLGYAVGPRELIAAMTRLQGQSTSNACSISQFAALEALNNPDEDIEVMAMVRQFDQRRLRMLELLERIPELSCVRPQGAFYAFPKVSAYFGRRTADGQAITSSSSLAAYLLDQAQVATVPGSVFGAADHIRLSYACSPEEIERGVERIAVALGALV